MILCAPKDFNRPLHKYLKAFGSQTDCSKNEKCGTILISSNDSVRIFIHPNFIMTEILNQVFTIFTNVDSSSS